MKKKMKIISPVSGSVPNAFFLIIAILLTACGHKRENDEAMMLEKAGRKAEALYLYSQILEDDPDNFTANQRTGFILAENRASFTTAVFHLNKALILKNTDADTQLKLFDLYLLSRDANKAEEILGMTQMTTFYPTIQLVYNCVFSEPATAKKSFITLNSLNPEDQRLTGIIQNCQQIFQQK